MKGLNYTILAIDTSCDETAVAVVRGFSVLSNALHTQLDLHKEYGGVVPSIAKLEHQKKFNSVLREALTKANLSIQDIEAIAVTRGPGLAIALEVGILKAKEIAEKQDIPLIAVNHMEGHLLSVLGMPADSDVETSEGGGGLHHVQAEFPILGLLVSGGHTEFVLTKGFGNYTKVGQTVDDACGEAYDKAGRMLGLGYPGGPIISKYASAGQSRFSIKFERSHNTLFARSYRVSDGSLVYELPIPMANSNDLNVSYSGLKTAFKELLRTEGITEEKNSASTENIEDLCVIFEATAIKALTHKLEKAIEKYSPNEVWLGGGVVASPKLRAEVKAVTDKKGVVLRVPSDRKLMTDNAAMIGITASLRLQSNFKAKNDLKEVFQPSELVLLDRDSALSL